jgi:trk system potassium uptake protein TrkA
MKTFLVLGLGRFGTSLSSTLIDLGHEVMGVDVDPKNVKHMADKLTYAMEADLSDEDFLRSIDVTKYDAVVIGVGSSFQVSVMAAVMLKELGAKYVLTKAQNDFQAKVLYKLGVDSVILPEKDMGIKTAHSLVTDRFVDVFEVSDDYSILNIHPPEEWIGKSLKDLSLRSRHKLNILAIQNPEKTKMLIPDAETVISEEDIITVMGENSDLKKMERKN